VGFAGGGMETLPDHRFPLDHHRSHQRIRRCGAPGPFGQLQRHPHEFLICGFIHCQVYLFANHPTTSCICVAHRAWSTGTKTMMPDKRIVFFCRQPVWRNMVFCNSRFAFSSSSMRHAPCIPVQGIL
jgi:hypothetical protein